MLPVCRWLHPRLVTKNVSASSTAMSLDLSQPETSVATVNRGGALPGVSMVEPACYCLYKPVRSRNRTSSLQLCPLLRMKLLQHSSSPECSCRVQRWTQKKPRSAAGTTLEEKEDSFFALLWSVLLAQVRAVCSAESASQPLAAPCWQILNSGGHSTGQGL